MSRATRVPCLSLILSTFDRQPTTYRGPDDALTMTIAFYQYLALLPSPMGPLTSLLVQLFQYLSDDLSYTL